MEEKIKLQLIKSADAVKNKLKQMKNQEHEINLSLDKILKPVSEPLKTLVNLKKKCPQLEPAENEVNSESFESEESITSCSTKCDDFYDADLNFATPIKNKVKDVNLEISLEGKDVYGIYDGVNVPFGIRTDNKQLMIGNSIVSFSKIDSVDKNNVLLVKIDDKTYNLTPGLKELLLQKKPDLKTITSEDKMIYKNILLQTNAHKRDFNPGGQIRGDKGTKYRDIIKPLFSITSNEKKQTKLGGSLPKLKKYRTQTDLVYWDDPNELVERLKLLIASRDAGNTNHDNEILSIIEELKEARVIKE